VYGKPLSQLAEVPEHMEKIDETILSSHIFAHYTMDLELMRKCDIVVVGSGLSAMSSVYSILKSVARKCSPPVKIAVLEKQGAIGTHDGTTGGIFPYTVVRKPAHKLLDETGMAGLYKDEGKFVVIETSTLHSALLSKITHLASNHTGVELKFFPGIDVADILLEDPMAFSPVKGLAASLSNTHHHSRTESDGPGPANLDVPIFMGCKVIVSAGGLNQNTQNGLSRALVRLNNYGFSGTSISDEPFLHRAVDVNLSEDAMIHYTREVSPGLIAAGSEVCWLDYISHPPSVAGGGRLLSGLKAGKLAVHAVSKARESEFATIAGYETAAHFLHDDVVGGFTTDSLKP
jgi:thiamine thiazole synthase